ncbi:MAG: Glucose 1-dehydrogenase [Verrucomicrobiota bacterium]|jgi:threonine dehydrogenase-like Zn-dependent dehydrogenase
MNQPKMRAVAVVPSQRQVAQVEHAHPELSQPTHLKVRTLDVGICGTDREICTFVYGAPPAGSDHLVLGHEALGEVVEVGAGVKHLKVGDLVVPSVRRPCPDVECRPCQIDRQDFCATWKFNERGINQHHGYMTEFFVDDEKNFVVVPKELRQFAVLAEPLTIAEKGLAQVWAIQKRLPWACEEPGQPKGKGLRAVVLGAGPIGILGAMTCVLNGFDTYVYSRSPKPNDKAALVESFGAKYLSIADTTPAQLAERVGNIDLVYEAVGVAKTSFDVMMHLGLNGVFVFTGIPAPEGHVELEGNQLMRNLVLKNQVVLGTVNADKAAFQAAIRDLGEFQKRWPDALAKVISARHPIENFSELLTGKATGIKNVIAFGK